jgi:ketosteroid isomerase-like protein
MSQANVELVRKGFERFVATGEPACWLFEDWATASSEWSAEPEEYIDAGEKVIVVIRVKATGRGSGVALERQDAIVYGMRDGVVVRMDYHNNRKRALKAAGLAG